MLTPIDTVKLFENRPELSFKAGDVIFQAGAKETFMYGILEGEVDLYLKERLIETLKKGDIFGEGALLHSDHVRTSTAIAKTDCLLGPMDQHHFLFAVQQTPMFAVEVLRSYSDRFRHVKELLLALI